MIRSLKLLGWSVIIAFFTLQFISCDKIETTLPVTPPEDSVLVVNGSEYAMVLTVGDTVLNFKNRIDHVGNSVYKENFGPCFFGAGNDTRFSSYFAYVSDTSRTEKIIFGLTNCVSDTADGFSDSTYMVGVYPMEIPYPDSTIGFINYIDSNSVLWSTSMGQNGYEAQELHTFEVTSVGANFDGTSALEVRGHFTGWVYNIDGDSLLVNCPSFFSKAWAL